MKNLFIFLTQFLLFIPFISDAQALQRVKYTPEGIINSMAYNENYGLFVGGSFENWGINTGATGLFTANSDLPDSDFPRFYDVGPSGDIISDGNGGWFMSRQGYTLVNENDSLNVPSSNIYHILSNKKFDYNFLSQTQGNGFVQFALKNNVLYAVGSEIQISPGVFTSLLAFNTTTGAPIACPLIRGNTNSIVIAGNTMYISGNISSVDGVTVNKKWIAINLGTGNLKNWNPFQNDSNYGWGGFKIYQTGGKIIIPYLRMDVNKIGIAAFDTLTATSPLWKYEDENMIATNLGISPDKIIFPTADYSMSSRDMLLTAINLSDGAISPGWNPNSFRFRNLKYNNAHISGIKILNNDIYVVGRFETILGSIRNNAASINLANGTLNSWNPSPAQEMVFIEISGSNILCGTNGNCIFKSVQRPQIGLLNPITHEIIPNSFPFLPNAPLNQYQVGKLATNKEVLWVAFNGNIFPGYQDIGAYDIRTGVKINSPIILSNDSYVGQPESKWITVDSLLYIKPYVPSASEPTVNGQVRKGIFAISTSGNLHPFSIDVVPQSVNDFKIAGDLIYISGSFTQINGVNRKYLACVNRLTGQLTDWNPNPERPVNDIEIFGNTIVFSGYQAYVGGFTNTNSALNITFLIDRMTGKFVRTIDKPVSSGYGQKSGNLLAKDKYIFLGTDENSPCNTADGKSLSYYNNETRKYPKKCIIPNYNSANTIDVNQMLFADSRLFVLTDYRGNNGFYYQGRQRILQVLFPQGFFNEQVDYFPKKGHNGGSLTVHFYNYNISYGTKVRLLKTGQTPISAIDSLSSYPENFTLKTTFSLKNKTTGNWDVELTLPTGQKIVIPNGFKINPPTPANIQLRIIAPAATRPGAPIKLPIIVSNLGESNAYNNQIWITVNHKTKIRLPIYIVSDSGFVERDTLTDFISIIGGNPPSSGGWLTLPVIGSGESITLPVGIDAPIDGSAPVGVTAFPSDPWALDPNDYSYPSLLGPAIECLKAIGGLALGALAPPIPGLDCVNSAGDAVGALSNSPQDRPADTFAAISGAVWDCLGKPIGRKAEVLKTIGDAIQKVIGLGEMVGEGLDVYDKCKAKKKTPSEVTIPIITSKDPNDKIGPAGVRTQRYIRDKEPMNYLIRFENYASATADAQYVKVIDTLDINKFDFSTFQFGYFNVADTNFYAPPGRKTYLRDWDLRPAKNLIVRMEASFSDTTGILKATYTALDPATMEWTEDPFLGFLPPNVNAPEGEGGVFFSISPKTTLVHNEQISNKAHIYFDYNPVIPTPVWTNTLDKMIPSSQVQSLPSISRDTTFTLRWTGNDVGAGTRLYDIFVSVNNNPYKLLVANSNLKNFTFKGKPDSTYRFYSIAVDSVGNQEATPLTFDTQTTIRLDKLIQSVKSGDWNNPSTWNCNCIPTIADNVVIKSGHKVVVSPSMGTLGCKNIIVEIGAVFDGRGIFKADSKY